MLPGPCTSATVAHLPKGPPRKVGNIGGGTNKGPPTPYQPSAEKRKRSAGAGSRRLVRHLCCSCATGRRGAVDEQISLAWNVAQSVAWSTGRGKRWCVFSMSWPPTSWWVPVVSKRDRGNRENPVCRVYRPAARRPDVRRNLYALPSVSSSPPRWRSEAGAPTRALFFFFSVPPS